MARKNPLRRLAQQSQNLDDTQKRLIKMKYGLVGKHSAVQLCHWTKSGLRGGEVCWKEKMYGISSAGCAQMTPAVSWCEHNCVHCWRPLEMYKGADIKADTLDLDDPVEILDGIVEKRKELMMGFKGSEKTDQKIFEKSLTPSLFTMSLSGEPTLYPRLGELFAEIRKRGAVSFLVTNGLNPEVIEKMITVPGNELPTQLVISTNAPNKLLYNMWHQSRKSNAWEKFNETLDFMTARGIHFSDDIEDEISSVLTRHPEIVRVWFDPTKKPPATTEME